MPRVQVTGYTGAEELAGALKGAELVVIPAGVPRKPGMTRDDLFNINAGIVKTLCEGVAASCPDAIIAIIRCGKRWAGACAGASPRADGIGARGLRDGASVFKGRCSNVPRLRPALLRVLLTRPRLATLPTPLAPPQQPRQLHSAHLRGGAEEGGRVQPAQGGQHPPLVTAVHVCTPGATQSLPGTCPPAWQCTLLPDLPNCFPPCTTPTVPDGQSPPPCRRLPPLPASR